MAGKLVGQVALVTGASSGIGEATAIALAALGAKVVAVARRSARLDALAQRIQQQGGTLLPIMADITDETQVREVVSQTQAQFGRIDSLINNAGLMLLGMIDGADTQDWRRMFNVNVLGLMYATHAVLPIMRTQGSGHIVNLSSVAGRTVRAGAGAYNATKWAVNAFSDALRQEVYLQPQEGSHYNTSVPAKCLVGDELRTGSRILTPNRVRQSKHYGTIVTVSSD